MAQAKRKTKTYQGAELTPKQHRALTLSKAMPVKAVAKKMNVKPNAVYAHLRAAREAIAAAEVARGQAAKADASRPTPDKKWANDPYRQTLEELAEQERRIEERIAADSARMEDLQKELSMSQQTLRGLDAQLQGVKHAQLPPDEDAPF